MFLIIGTNTTSQIIVLLFVLDPTNESTINITVLFYFYRNIFIVLIENCVDPFLFTLLFKKDTLVIISMKTCRLAISKL